jgi:hypothetical protein
MSGAFCVAQSRSRWKVAIEVAHGRPRRLSVGVAALSTCEHQYAFTTSL